MNGWEPKATDLSHTSPNRMPHPAARAIIWPLDLLTDLPTDRPIAGPSALPTDLTAAFVPLVPTWRLAGSDIRGMFLGHEGSARAVRLALVTKDRFVEVEEVREIVRRVPRIEVHEIPIERIVRVPKKIIQELCVRLSSPCEQLAELVFGVL